MVMLAVRQRASDLQASLMRFVTDLMSLTVESKSERMFILYSKIILSRF